MKRSDLAWALLLAGVARILFLLLWSPELTGDALAYHRLGAGLARGHGFVDAAGDPTSWRPPGYPAFVGAVYAAVGVAPTAVRALQVLLDLGTVALVGWMGARLFGRRAGLVAALLVAVDPATAAATSRLLSESLFTFLLVAASAFLLVADGASNEAKSGSGVGFSALAGVGLGLATLTRGLLIFYPLMAAGALWRWRRGQGVRAAGVLLAAYVLTLAPWTVRNYRVHDALVPVATQGGRTLYGSYFPPDGWRFGILPDDDVIRAASELPEPEASSFLVRETIRRVAARPGRLPGLEIRKVLFFWVPLDWEILPWQGALNPVYLVILALAGYRGLAHWRPREGEEASRPVTAWPLWLPVAYFFLMALAFYGSPRFRLPVEPFLALLAGAGADLRIRRVGPRRAAVEGGLAAVAVVALALGLEPLKALARRLVAGA